MRSLGWYLFVLVSAALVPLLAPRGPARAAGATSFPGWPELEAGRALAELPLTESERGFAESFPGKIARFGDGQRQYVVRWITAATRRVHPAEDCFRASGFSIHHQPRCSRPDEGVGCFTAERDGVLLDVHEWVEDSEGKRFSDVSAWYWAAVRGASKGPWWSVTRVRPEGSSQRTAPGRGGREASRPRSGE